MNASCPIQKYTVIVPAAGAGKRMLSSYPKQYLLIGNDCVLTHTINNLLSHPLIQDVVVSLSEKDEYFNELALSKHSRVHQVVGGAERVNSVLNGLLSLSVKDNLWVLVHDAARPCVTHDDITALIERCVSQNCGGLLAVPIVDTLKKSYQGKQHNEQVEKTIDRTGLWQALTPQMYKTEQLIDAIKQAMANSLDITDESSAIELANIPSMIVTGNRCNIKITRPEDLALAAFYLEHNFSLK